jgi:hypothetical protein
MVRTKGDNTVDEELDWRNEEGKKFNRDPSFSSYPFKTLKAHVID